MGLEIAILGLGLLVNQAHRRFEVIQGSEETLHGQRFSEEKFSRRATRKAQRSEQLSATARKQSHPIPLAKLSKLVRGFS